MTQAEVTRGEMGWWARGRESACGNTGHRPVYSTLPALPTDTCSAFFLSFRFPCLIWQLLSDLLSAGNCSSQQRGSVRTPFLPLAPPWVAPVFLCTPGACVRTTQVHTYLLPRIQGKLGGLDILIILSPSGFPWCLDSAQVSTVLVVLICLSHLHST